jgi:hypothetical protein
MRQSKEHFQAKWVPVRVKKMGQTKAHFQAKWIPVRVKKMRRTKAPLSAHRKKEASLAAGLLRETSIHAY